MKTSRYTNSQISTLIVRRSKPMFFLIKAAFRRYFMMIGMSLIPFSAMRVMVLRICGVKVGRDCYIGFNVICDTNFPELIRIGDAVTISHNCMLISHTQTPCDSWLGKLYHLRASVNVGNGAWIGACCILLPGVAIGDDCMIGAGSVVTKSTDKRSMWAGNPIRRIKSLKSENLSHGG
jgi:acetyltransferase-like isoleucine patch superfamily enzyme